MLSKEKIEDELQKIGINPPKIVFYEETDSTNTRAKEYAKENPDSREPVVFIANGQTAGRGRRGRSFVSESGAGIYMSILTYPDTDAADATMVTARTAVSLAEAIESLCNCDVKLKWVNDLYLGGKKLAGILTEGELTEKGKIAYQVVGMGINVYKNAISEEISDIATSIEHESKSIPDRSLLTARVVKEFLLFDGKLYEEYKSRSMVIGKSVRVIKPTEQYEAKVLDLNEDFSLSIERGDKTERLFTGEVSLKI
jgi:BirA family biotin operon repressor/biotin-[acetyl-CoA-carboxylase] ligase